MEKSSEYVCFTKRNLFASLGWKIINRELWSLQKTEEEGGEQDEPPSFMSWGFYFWANRKLRSKEVLVFSRPVKSWVILRGSAESNSLILQMKKQEKTEGNETQERHKNYSTFVFQVILLSINPFNPHNLSMRSVTLFSFHK